MENALLDSSILIDFLRRKDKENSILVKFVKEQKKLYVSIITHTELYAGKSVWEKNLAKEELKKLFSGITIIPLDETISIKAGEIKAKHNINLLDAIIAATSITTKLHLATLNIKDFKKIRGLKILNQLNM